MIFLFRKFCDVILIIILILLTIFDSTLLVATYRNRKDGLLPISYLIIMSMSGIPEKLACIIAIGTGSFLSAENYEYTRELFGKQITMTLTFSYLLPLFLSFLMTLNRLIIVVRPFSAHLFTHSNIYKAGGTLAVLIFISLLIPYLSDCDVNLDAIMISFKSGCAPERHPITNFQNSYTILFPVIAMILNIGIILHLKFVRIGAYKHIGELFTKRTKPNNSSTEIGVKTTNDEFIQMQKKREAMMMKQSITIAIYLTIYEFSGLLMRLFPSFIMSLPEEITLIITYVRFTAAAAMNFSVYYIETPSTRKMVKDFLGLDNSKTPVSNIHDRSRRNTGF